MSQLQLEIGRDARLLSEHTKGVELESELRLRPGHPVDICRPAGARRAATIITWRVFKISDGRLTFRGFCEWQ